MLHWSITCTCTINSSLWRKVYGEEVTMKIQLHLNIYKRYAVYSFTAKIRMYSYAYVKVNFLKKKREVSISLDDYIHSLYVSEQKKSSFKKQSLNV